MNIRRLYKPEEFTINQLYMFMHNGRLKRGFCKEITESGITFNYEGETYRVKYIDYDYSAHGYVPTYFAEYNSSIYKKYYKLLEKQKEEIKTLLELNTFTENKQVNTFRESIKLALLRYFEMLIGKEIKKLEK